jgi:hypothetical protein
VAPTKKGNLLHSKGNMCTRRARRPMSRDNWTLNTVAVMADASLNRRQTIRVELAVSCLHVGMIGFDDAIELEAQRLYGLPQVAPGILNGTPTLQELGPRNQAAEESWNIPSLVARTSSLRDNTVAGTGPVDVASAALATSSRFCELAPHV